MSVQCPYCGNQAKLERGAALYPEFPHLHRSYFWVCRPCEAWVGCFKNSKTPMGIPGDDEDRAERRWAHAVFDPLHREGHMSRPEAYAWLCKELGLPKADCHMAKMNAAQCRKVIRLCNEKIVLQRAKRRKA